MGNAYNLNYCLVPLTLSFSVMMIVSGAFNIDQCDSQPALPILVLMLGIILLMKTVAKLIINVIIGDDNKIIGNAFNIVHALLFIGFLVLSYLTYYAHGDDEEEEVTNLDYCDEKFYMLTFICLSVCWTILTALLIGWCCFSTTLSCVLTWCFYTYNRDKNREEEG